MKSFYRFGAVALACVLGAIALPMLATAREDPREAADASPIGIPGLTEGRIVHYVLPAGEQNAGEHRPAIVVKLWEPLGGSRGTAQLLVFRDGSNDQKDPDVWDPTSPLVEWRTSVLHSDTHEPGTWHYPERV